MRYGPNGKEYISQIDTDLIKEALSSNDEIGVVLRAQFEIEKAVVRVLERKYPKYSALKHRYFNQHLKALRALGMDAQILKIAQKVNQVRNDMAHVGKGIKTKVAEKDIQELYAHASGIFGGEEFPEFTVQIGKNNESQRLKEMPISSQFLLIAAMTAMAFDAYLEHEA